MMNIYDILEALERIEKQELPEAQMGNMFMPGIENTPEYKKGYATGALPVPYPEGTQQYVNYYKGVMDKAGPKIDSSSAQKTATVPGVQEDGKFSFAGTKVGQRPGDQVHGTERATSKKSGAHPFKGRLVGSSESVEQEFESYLEDIIAEYGMTTGGTATTTTDTKDAAKGLATTQQSINKLKTAGVNIPNVQQAVKSTLKDPTKDPMTMQDKNVAQGLGQEVQDIIDQGGPAVDQLVNAVRKASQQKQQVGEK